MTHNPLDMFAGDMTPEAKTETPGAETVEPAFRYTPVPVEEQPVEQPVQQPVEQPVEQPAETEAPGVHRRTDKGPSDLFSGDTVESPVEPMVKAKRQGQGVEKQAPRASSSVQMGCHSIVIHSNGSQIGDIVQSSDVTYNNYIVDQDDHYYENDEPEQPGLIRRLLRAIVG